MQKVINVVAIFSGLTSVARIAGSGYLLLNKDAMINTMKENVAKSAVEAVSGALPGLIDSAMPKLPDATSGVIPDGDGSLPNIPGI